MQLHICRHVGADYIYVAGIVAITVANHCGWLCALMVVSGALLGGFTVRSVGINLL